LNENTNSTLKRHGHCTGVLQNGNKNACVRKIYIGSD
jgi:hypothetical protein